MIMESDLQFNNIDYKEVCKYLAFVCDKDTFKKHNLISVIPKKQTDLDGTSRREPTLVFLDNDTYTRIKDGVPERDVPKWNWSGVKAPTRLQKKRLVALTLMEVIRTTLQNHIYQLNDTLLRQVSGGPIGDNLRNLCAQLVMYTFSKRYKDKLTSLNLIDRVVLLKVYVDDQNQAGWTFPYGTMYLKGKIHIPGLGWRGCANKED